MLGPTRSKAASSSRPSSRRSFWVPLAPTPSSTDSSRPRSRSSCRWPRLRGPRGLPFLRFQPNGKPESAAQLPSGIPCRSNRDRERKPEHQMAAFLQQFPPRKVDRTPWSRVHRIERYRLECSCRRENQDIAMPALDHPRDIQPRQLYHCRTVHLDHLEHPLCRNLVDVAVGAKASIVHKTLDL